MATRSGPVARVAFAMLLVFGLVLLARAVWRSAKALSHPASELELGATWGWALLLLMLLGPVLLPWYVAWALPLAWLLPLVPRVALLGLSLVLAVSQWEGEPEMFPRAFHVNVLVGVYAIAPFVIALLGWLLWDGWRRWREGIAKGIERSLSEEGASIGRTAATMAAESLLVGGGRKFVAQADRATHAGRNLTSLTC